MDINQTASRKKYLLIFAVGSGLWIIGSAIIYQLFQVELLRFLEAYLTPDGELSSPTYTIARLILAPVLAALYIVLTITTFGLWSFPRKYVVWYYLLFAAHFVFYFYYLRFVLMGADPEDSLLEWGTFVLAFFGGVLFLICGLRGSRIAIILGTAWLLFGFEEISWGQRVFGIESPELFQEHNYQDELNLHNFLNPIQDYLYVPLNIFLLCFFTWFRKWNILSWMYRIQGATRVLKVSDKYGLWMIPMFLIFASVFPGFEFVEEQWGLFGFLLGLLLLIDLLAHPNAGG